VVPDLAEALREVRVSVAFSEKSAFRKEPTRACLQDLEGWIRSYSHSENATEAAPKIALVFGNERNGLSTDDIEGCSHVLRLHASSSLESMNLSHAVAVVLSRLFEARTSAGTSPSSQQAPSQQLQAATQGEREAFYEHLRELLQALELDRGGGPDRLLSTLRMALERALLRPNEVKAFRSICSRGIQKLTS
jgi:tRNA C32,U32 (ribose-2'-O)-methylase TrmJ